jgi:hypothetical protein
LIPIILSSKRIKSLNHTHGDVAAVVELHLPDLPSVLVVLDALGVAEEVELLWAVEHDVLLLGEP